MELKKAANHPYLFDSAEVRTDNNEDTERIGHEQQEDGSTQQAARASAARRPSSPDIQPDGSHARYPERLHESARVSPAIRRDVSVSSAPFSTTVLSVSDGGI